MTKSFRMVMASLMLVGAGIPLVVAATMVGDRPALAALMFATGVGVLAMLRPTVRWMTDPADWRHCD